MAEAVQRGLEAAGVAGPVTRANGPTGAFCRRASTAGHDCLINAALPVGVSVTRVGDHPTPRPGSRARRRPPERRWGHCRLVAGEARHTRVTVAPLLGNCERAIPIQGNVRRPLMTAAGPLRRDRATNPAHATGCWACSVHCVWCGAVSPCCGRRRACRSGDISGAAGPRQGVVRAALLVGSALVRLQVRVISATPARRTGGRWCSYQPFLVARYSGAGWTLHACFVSKDEVGSWPFVPRSPGSGAPCSSHARHATAGGALHRERQPANLLLFPENTIRRIARAAEPRYAVRIAEGADPPLSRLGLYDRLGGLPTGVPAGRCSPRKALDLARISGVRPGAGTARDHPAPPAARSGALRQPQGAVACGMAGGGGRRLDAATEPAGGGDGCGGCGGGAGVCLRPVLREATVKHQCHCEERSDAAISIAVHNAMGIASLRSQ